MFELSFGEGSPPSTTLLAKVMAFLSLSWGTKPTAPWGLWRGYPREQGSSSAGRTCPGRTCTLCSHHRCAGKKYAAIERGQLERDIREHTRCPADSFPCIGSSLLELQNFHETFESDFYPIPVTLYFGPFFQYFTNQECLSHTSLQLKKHCAVMLPTVSRTECTKPHIHHYLILTGRAWK